MMHSNTFHGIAHGKIIELFDELGVPDGTHVSVRVQPAQPDQEAFQERRSAAAGAWADFPEMDEIMAAIERDRANDSRAEDAL
jgi:hypothetical protein